VSSLTVEPTETRESAPCECCGERTRRAWGFLHEGDDTKAAYLVEWTSGKVDRHGAFVDLIIGNWADTAGNDERFAVSLDCRFASTGPAFTVGDAGKREIARSELVGRSLSRAEIVGTPRAKEILAMVNAIWAGDPRLAEVRQVPGPTH
jgi:hypothetical protein